jgi:hypothetical protein
MLGGRVPNFVEHFLRPFLEGGYFKGSHILSLLVRGGLGDRGQVELGGQLMLGKHARVLKRLVEHKDFTQRHEIKSYFI